TGSTDASGSCAAKLSNGVRDVTVSVGGNYTGTAKARVETTRDQTRAVLGTGQLSLAHSAGTYAAAAGTKANLSLVLAHGRNTTTGFEFVTFQSGGKQYQIRAARFDSFGAKSSTLDLRGPAAIYAGDQQVASGVLQLTAHGDSVALTLMDGNTL